MNKNFKKVAVQAAKKAGKILMTYYAKEIKVEFKTDAYDAVSIVTKADIKSEEKIIAILKENFPDHGIYGEESMGTNMDADYIWYVDPLDGTSNFSRHIPLFGISIGLVYKGKPIVGVLYFPALNLLVSAEDGQGCFVNNKLTKVSSRKISESLYYAGGKFKGDPQIKEAIYQKCALVKIIDASSYEFAQIAMGDAEIYYLTNVPHDVVAGVCIVQEAGGRVTDGLGAPWTINSKNILATNGLVHEEIIDDLKRTEN
jgi:myo-inositol-1(or 4)-monophosphatase